ncbi:uncharacterized protein LOC108462682 [Gossypium arboreum]|uniref:uncharacterized protein LOC108462682 n=1 Tax=Gossypium arboreum TaxID=29729 RepID=UPI0008195C6D|nr:uncharacterized protein LOC108462682 [Gossypium arboreum]
MPNLDISETLVSPATETGSHNITLSVAEYWIEATERIIDDLDFTTEQKLKEAVSLLRDEAYQWWLTVKKGAQPELLTWEYFKTIFLSKYVRASYIDARRREFLNLTQGDRSVAEYEAEFLRLSRYAQGMVLSEYERCVCFEDSLKNNLRVLITPQREREFAILVDKVKIAEDVKRVEQKGQTDRQVRVGLSVAPTGVALCGHCGRRHSGECWRAIGACLSNGSTEHRVQDYPLRADQVQVLGSGTVQPPRVVQ